MSRQSKESKKQCSKRRKERGLCRDCPKVARKGRVKCTDCFQKDLVRQEAYLSQFNWKKAETRRFKKYGVTPEQYVDMFFDQNGRCGICRKFILKIPHLDHNHETNKARGLLCSRCNTALWILEDKTLKQKAEKYLNGDQLWQILKKQSN